MRWLLLLLPVLLFSINEENKSDYFKILQERQDPYTFDKKARLELQKVKIEAETKKKIAEIEYKKAVDTKKIEKETVVEKATKEVEKEKISTSPKTLAIKAREKLIYYTFIFGVLLLLLILFLYRRYHITKERIEMERLRAQKEAHEKELEKEILIKEREIQAQMAGKLIDAIASGKLSKEQEEKLLTLASTGANLLENKGKRGKDPCK
ncbi:MAG: hypothetical protein GXO19_01155 [Epsilonproteobacteria bacterium]|nr:hypothetical protein [Campylobacterota bacterium]NPA56322.1 hypothetical protein [Campylobacterota bacterium]